MNKRILGALLATALAGGVADAKPRAPFPDHPDAPNPARGERLDGRPAPKDPKRYALFLPRALLFVPRIAALTVLGTTNELIRANEESQLGKKLYRWTTSDDGLVGIRPTVAWESGFAPGAGVRFFDRRTFGPGTENSAAFTFSAVDNFKLEGTINPIRNDILHLTAEWEREPSEIFAGLDGVTRDELDAQGRDIARFSSRVVRGGIDVGDRHGMGRWSLILDAVTADYGEGSPRSSDPSIETVWCADPTAGCMEVDPALVPGFDRGMNLARLGGSVGLDTRGNARFANGVALRVDGHVARGIGDDPSRHGSVRAEGRASVAIREREIVLRVRTGMIEAFGDAPVPFEELLTPGGRGGLRALSGGRLRGHSELLGSVNYSWLLSARFDATLFVDYGGAFAERYENFSFDRMIPGVGLSLNKYKLARHAYHLAPSQTGLTIAWAPEEGFRFTFAFVD